MNCQFAKLLGKFSYENQRAIAILTRLDPEAPGFPDRGAQPRKYQGGPSRHEIGRALAVPSTYRPTKRGIAMPSANHDLNRLRHRHTVRLTDILNQLDRTVK